MKAMQGGRVALCALAIVVLSGVSMGGVHAAGYRTYSNFAGDKAHRGGIRNYRGRGSRGVRMRGTKHNSKGKRAFKGRGKRDVHGRRGSYKNKSYKSLKKRGRVRHYKPSGKASDW